MRVWSGAGIPDVPGSKAAKCCAAGIWAGGQVKLWPGTAPRRTSHSLRSAAVPSACRPKLHSLAMRRYR